MFKVNANSATHDNSISNATRIQKFYYDKASRTIVAFGTDGHKRYCRIDNFEDINDARKLYQDIKDYFKNRTPIHFVARGNNSANNWFFKVKEF